MADTVDLNNLTEYFDTSEELTAKLSELASMIQDSKHMIIFTGAGISTSASIPDFRGPTGVWTCQAQGVAAPESIPLAQAIPTPCHNLIRQFVEDGTCKYVVSQNIDGLHRRSGIPRDSVSELHGNCFLEVCWKCGADQEHPVEVQGGRNPPKSCDECMKRVPYFCHCTGRKCRECDAVMKDSIIHFQENLPEQALTRAYQAAKDADLCIVFGSSITVSPACDIPAKVGKKRKGKLVIINLQETPLDDLACLRLYAKTDDVAHQLAGMLGVNIAATTDSEERVPVQAEEVPQPPPAPVINPDVTLSAQRRMPLANNNSGPQGPLLFEIGNKYLRHTDPDNFGNEHEWMMFVRPLSDEAKAALDDVIYTLHPTFDPPKLQMRKSRENPHYEMSRLGWGTFTIKVELSLFNGQCTQKLKHDLVFGPEKTTQIYQIEV